MRRVRYAVAVSLDGFIAGPNGEADWIPMDPDLDFGAFYSQFDAALIGRRTFEAMSGKDSAMPGMATYVFSRTLPQSDYRKVKIVAEGAAKVVADLRNQPGKDIWLFGGGELFRSLAEAQLVDTVELAVAPVLLGGGIPLRPLPADRLNLDLQDHKVYKTGMVSLTYAIRRAARAAGRQSKRKA